MLRPGFQPSGREAQSRVRAPNAISAGEFTLAGVYSRILGHCCREMMVRSMSKSVYLLLFSVISIAFAQVDTGTISGLVRDPSGAAIPRVQVMLKDEATGLTTEVATNQAGLFVSPPLRAGSYVVEVRAKGFETAARRVQLDVSIRREVDFDLTVGALSETVAVKDVAGVLQTDTSTLSNLRSPRKPFRICR